MNNKGLQIKEIIEKHPELENELSNVSSVEDIKSVFQAHGCELTDQDLDAIMETVLGSCASTEELDETALDAVAGGGRYSQAWRAGVRVGMACRMVYDYYKYGNAQKNYTIEQLIKGSFL